MGAREAQGENAKNAKGMTQRTQRRGAGMDVCIENKENRSADRNALGERMEGDRKGAGPGPDLDGRNAVFKECCYCFEPFSPSPVNSSR